MFGFAENASQSALNLALTEQAKTVTLAHLRKTAMAEARVEAALRNALESEAELTETDGSRPTTPDPLGAARRSGVTIALRPRRKSQESTTGEFREDYGTRAPGRDAIGSKPDEDASCPLMNEEQAAG